MAAITEILLRNFKSFRSAHVPMKKGFVCIVGPNGAGKSNFIDSIRFAFGESSLRALRARRVQDLIYQGGDKALIKLKIEGINSGDGKAEIIRAIRKDGKTFCRLNGKRVTRNALVDFLRLENLEIGSHNVIAQGEVDKIVRLNPKERREILDEIAGISEFEIKKREALNELGKVEQKLNDANIILKEREGVLAELEKERDAALKYSSLKNEEKRIKGTLVITEYQKVENDFTGFVNKCIEIKEKIDELEKEKIKITEEINSLEGKKVEINNQIASKDTRNIYTEVEQLRGKIETDKGILREKENNLINIKNELKKLEEENEVIKEKFSSFSTAKREAAAQVVELKQRLGQLELEKTKRVKYWEEKRKQLRIFDEELDRKKEEVSLIKQELAKLSTKMEKTVGTESESTIQNEINEIEEKIKALKDERDTLFIKEKELNVQIQNLDSSIIKLSEEIASARGAAGTLPRALTFILEMKEKDNRIYGTVGEIFTADKKYQIAIETAAGQRLNYVVVQDIQTATDIIKILKEKNIGRVTFIPLNVKFNEERLKNEINVEGIGILGRVLDFVKSDKKFSSVLKYVFGETVLVESVDTFKKLSNIRAVTLDGDLLEPSGVITGGAAVKRSLREYFNLSALEKELISIKKSREALIFELYEINEKITKLRREIAEYEIKKKELDIKLNQIFKEQKEEDLEKIKINYEEDLKEKEREILNLQGEKERIRIAIENAEDEKEISNFDTEITDTKTKLSALEAKLKGEEEVILQERLNAINKNIENLNLQRKNLELNIKEIEKRIKQNIKNLELKEEKIKDESKILEKLWEESKKLQEKIDLLNIEQGKIDRKIERLKEEMIRNETLKEEIKKRVADLKYEADFYKDIELIDAKKEDLEKRLSEVDRELQSIGSVNLKALEVYEEKLKDYNEIKSKVAVLSSEKNAVLKMIEEIEFKKREVFLKTFKSVSDHFKNLAKSIYEHEVELKLENETNPFEGGLQIILKTGKKERNIEALSGGEKSLLTIVFVFALHMYKPSPFYILDEVEAALDKENSKKFSDFIKEISKNTQFIVVSHNDAVVPAADIAIGVTKTKQGSKVVSIKLT